MLVAIMSTIENNYFHEELTEKQEHTSGHTQVFGSFCSEKDIKSFCFVFNSQSNFLSGRFLRCFW